MKRKALGELRSWKDSLTRKPLLLVGVRKVGKTWLLKQFAKECYESLVFFDFAADKELKSVFASSKDPKRILPLLSMIAGKSILPGKTLIVFDEIQECPEALNSLKYFKETAPEYHIAVAGSLLGSLLAEPKSFPVGMVNIVNLGPLDFEEFLEAANPSLYSYYQTIEKGSSIPDIFHKRLLEAFDNYLITGGMPEAVASWTEFHDPDAVYRVQKELLSLYENDIGKYNGKIDAGRILLVYRSLVSQLAKPNEKFVYGAVKEGARAREFERAIEWLVASGLVLRVHNLSKIEQPLPAYDKLDQFKLFFFDVGLLKSMAGVDNRAIILNSDFQFKGPLAENYVLEQLLPQFEVGPRYYSDQKGKLDFVLQDGMDVVPVEVKAGEDRSAPSFKRYIAASHPKIAIRFSRMGYRKDGEITNIPFYLAAKAKKLI